MKLKLQNVIRKDSLSSFGFGTDAMKKQAVCPNCHSLQNSENTTCSVCKTKLTKSTLYDLYKSKHKLVMSVELWFQKECTFVLIADVF